MGASDVEIGEVGAVGLVEVVVAVVRSVEGGCDHGRKEIARSTLLLLEEDLVDEAFEDTPLLERRATSVKWFDISSCLLLRSPSKALEK